MNSIELEWGRVPVSTAFRDIRQAINSLRQVPELTQIAAGSRRAGRSSDALDRRTWNRFAVETAIQVCPVGFDGDAVLYDMGAGGELLATTKDLSLRGVGFVHERPLETPYALVSLALPSGSLTLLLEIRWANREHEHGYMSGGLFQGIVETPCEQ